MTGMDSQPVAYRLPDDSETQRILEKAAESLAPGSRDMVINSLEQGRSSRARKALLVGADTTDVQENPPIKNYGRSVDRSVSYR